MGADTFFSKIASMDPLAHTLDLPGANKYTASQASHDAQNAKGSGPYAGVQASLTAANQGYAPGGTGAITGWHQPVLPTHGGFQGFMQNVAANAPVTSPNPGRSSISGPGLPAPANVPAAPQGQPLGSIFNSSPAAVAPPQRRIPQAPMGNIY